MSDEDIEGEFGRFEVFLEDESEVVIAAVTGVALVVVPATGMRALSALIAHNVGQFLVPKLLIQSPVFPGPFVRNQHRRPALQCQFVSRNMLNLFSAFTCCTEHQS